MNDTQFTPGPWHYQEESDAYTHILRDSTGEFIASTPQWSNGIAEANARLIAAAPELYEALKRVLENKHEPDKIICIAEAALAKAVRP